MDFPHFYETSLHERGADGTPGLRFITVPVRSVDPEVARDPARLAARLGIRRATGGEGLPGMVEAWNLPFILDQMMGRQTQPPDRLGRRFGVVGPERRLRRRGPSTFAQYAAYAPVIPFESSPLGAKSLADLVTAGGGVGAALGSYATGDPILLVVAAGGVIVCGAARGISDALRIGLRARILELMGVDDPERQGARDDDPDAEPSSTTPDDPD
jgi:hypothetical protein